ncbi:MAG: putative protein N(5)-glutamine methyltransferase, partial [Streptomyces sp.]|nr:putative protein N(5)-glutamine methyltransferase [Streptomyces sp.]
MPHTPEPSAPLPAAPLPPVPADAVVARLRAAGCVFAEDEARIILDTAATAAEAEA